jgi:hypothetical protein
LRISSGGHIVCYLVDPVTGGLTMATEMAGDGSWQICRGGDVAIPDEPERCGMCRSRGQDVPCHDLTRAPGQFGCE